MWRKPALDWSALDWPMRNRLTEDFEAQLLPVEKPPQPHVQLVWKPL